MFQPLGGLVTVIPDVKKDKTKGGLALPENFADVMITGTVRNVGLGNKMESGLRDRPALSPGDKVMVAQSRDHHGKAQPYPMFTDVDVVVFICNAQDIWGIIEPAVVN
jgi:co-chaperonin GroES (HSP10)